MIWRRNNKIEKEKNSRIKIIMAIIFLGGILTLGRLYILQIKNHDLYSAKALGQHSVSSILEPERGRIFLSDTSAGETDKLYPIASNKEFAFLYAIPKEIKNSRRTAEILYFVFKKEKVEKEVDEFLAKEDKIRESGELGALKNLSGDEKKKKEEEIKNRLANLKNDNQWREAQKIKREAEINLRKEKIISGYSKSLNKGEDPFEPLEKKVEEETLKKLYSILSADILNQNSQTASSSEIFSEGIDRKKLVIEDNAIYFKDADNKKRELKFPGIAFFSRLLRYYPEINIGAHILGFVGLEGEKQKGHYGLEGFFDNELCGVSGSIKTERGASGDLVIVGDRQYNKPQNGSDVILTIDHAIQFSVCDKLNKAVLRHGADGGSAIVIDPKTGAILAMCSYPDFDPNNYSEVEKIKIFNNPAIFDQYEPGSIFKVITMAAGLDNGDITPDTMFNDSGPVKIKNYTIENSDRKSHGLVTMTNVLEQSLNTGVIFVARKIEIDNFKKYIRNFGFGEKTGIELEGESRGNIKGLDDNINKDLNLATISFGQGISVTPLQMAAAFSSIANDGIMMKPYIVREIIKNNGEKEIINPRQIKRTISERAATLLGGMMVNVVENGHGQKAGVKGYWVAGKTGTAQIPKKDGRGYEANAHIGSFAGFAPVDNPKFAMIVRIDNPRDVEWAESSAAPLFGEIAEFLLNYWQVPLERK